MSIADDIALARQLAREGLYDITFNVNSRAADAAARLLRSLSDEVERLHQLVAVCAVVQEQNAALVESLLKSRDRLLREQFGHQLDIENPALYDAARRVCHQFGLPWTDPRTDVTYPPPVDGFDERGLCDECQRTRKQGHHASCADRPGADGEVES